MRCRERDTTSDSEDALHHLPFLQFASLELHYPLLTTSVPIRHISALWQCLIHSDLLGNSYQNFFIVGQEHVLPHSDPKLHILYILGPNFAKFKIGWADVVYLCCVDVLIFFWERNLFRTHVECYTMLSKIIRNGDNSKLCEEELKNGADDYV